MEASVPHASSQRCARPAAWRRSRACSRSALSGSRDVQRPGCRAASSAVFTPMPAPTSSTSPARNGRSARAQELFQFAACAKASSSVPAYLNSAIRLRSARTRMDARQAADEQLVVADRQEAEVVAVAQDEERDDA